MSLQSLERATTPDTCTICENEWQFGGWGSYHGRCQCDYCGAPWQIMTTSNPEDSDDIPYVALPELGQRVIKAYYQDTGNLAPIVNHTTGEVQKKPLFTGVEVSAFNDWVRSGVYETEYAIPASREQVADATGVEVLRGMDSSDPPLPRERMFRVTPDDLIGHYGDTSVTCPVCNNACPVRDFIADGTCHACQSEFDIYLHTKRRGGEQ